MKFTGTIVQDGHSAEVSGVGSGTFHAAGHQIAFSFKKTAADGRISFSVTKAGQCLGSSATESKFGGVRGEISHHWVVTKECFSTF